MNIQAFSLHTGIPNNKWKNNCDHTEEISYVIMHCILGFVRKEDFIRGYQILQFSGFLSPLFQVDTHVIMLSSR